jgi:hypothetical protein
MKALTLFVNVRQDCKKIAKDICSSLFCHSSSDKDNGFITKSTFVQKSAGLTRKYKTSLKDIHRSKHSILFCNRGSDKENGLCHVCLLYLHLLKNAGFFHEY